MTNKQPKDKYQNLGCAGFLIHKTLQPCSLHTLLTPSINDLQNYNLPLYLYKKFEQYRKEKGTNKIPQEFLTSVCLRIKLKQAKKDSDELQTTALQKKLTYREIIQGKSKELKEIEDQGIPNQLQTPDYQDENLKGIVKQLQNYKLFGDFNEELEPLKQKKNPIKEDYQKQLHLIIDGLMDDGLLKKLYKKFKMIKMSNRFQMLKQQNMNKQVLTKSINLVLKSQEDKAETNYYIHQVIDQCGVKLGGLDESEIQKDKKLFSLDESKKDKAKEDQNKQEKQKASEEFMDKAQQQKLIEIFQATHQNFDGDWKNSVSQLSKKAQQSEQLFSQLQMQTVKDIQTSSEFISFHKIIIVIVEEKNKVNYRRFVRLPKANLSTMSNFKRVIVGNSLHFTPRNQDNSIQNMTDQYSTASNITGIKTSSQFTSMQPEELYLNQLFSNKSSRQTILQKKIQEYSKLNNKNISQSQVKRSYLPQKSACGKQSRPSAFYFTESDRNTKPRSNEETRTSFSVLLGQCNELLKKSTKDQDYFSYGFESLKKEKNKLLVPKLAKEKKQLTESQNTEYQDYLEMKQFKKKLISFLIEKIDKKDTVTKFENKQAKKELVTDLASNYYT